MKLFPLIKVRPYQDESPNSILLRSSSLNGYKGPVKQLNHLKVSHGEKLSPSLHTITSNPKQFKLACETLGIHSTNLDLIKPVREHDYPHADYFIGGIFVRRKHFAKTSRYCPQCLKEKPYFRKIWDYLLYTSCHVHKVEIIEDCDDCGCKISWNRSHINECQCGAMLGQNKVIAEFTRASKIFFDTYNSGNTEQFDLLMDMSTALAQHYHLDRDDPEILNLSALGVENPEELAKRMVLEMQSVDRILIHPILSFQSFIKHPNHDVQNIANFAAQYIPHTDISYPPRSKNCDDISVHMAARLLGVKPLDIKALVDAQVLNTGMTTFDRTCPVSENSINQLVFRLSTLEQATHKPTMSIQKVITESQECFETYTVCSVVKKILNGDIKLVSLSLKKPLLNSVIQVPELKRLPEKVVFPMVWIGDLAMFIGIHPNQLREIINAEKGVKRFKGLKGTQHSTKKFLTLIEASRLLEKLKKIYLGSNVQGYSFDDLPKTDVEVLILNQ